MSTMRSVTPKPLNRTISPGPKTLSTRPVENWRGYKRITESTRTPILTGENGFGLEERFRELLDNRAVDAIHPDVCNSGGMLEVKRIADYAAVCGINTAFHQPGSPVAAYRQRACRRNSVSDELPSVGDALC